MAKAPIWQAVAIAGLLCVGSAPAQVTNGVPDFDWQVANSTGDEWRWWWRGCQLGFVWGGVAFCVRLGRQAGRMSPEV